MLSGSTGDPHHHQPLAAWGPTSFFGGTRSVLFGSVRPSGSSGFVVGFLFRGWLSVSGLGFIIRVTLVSGFPLFFFYGFFLLLFSPFFTSGLLRHSWKEWRPPTPVTPTPTPSTADVDDYEEEGSRTLLRHPRRRLRLRHKSNSLACWMTTETQETLETFTTTFRMTMLATNSKR